MIRGGKCRDEIGHRRVPARKVIVLVPVIVLALLSTHALGAETKTVAIFEGRLVSVEVPDGWQFGLRRDPDTDVQTMEIADPRGEIGLEVSIIPDREGRLATRKGLEDEMRKTLRDNLAGAVEREMSFRFVDEIDGLCGYASLTDRGPKGHSVAYGGRLIVTAGIRSWKGAYGAFTLRADSMDTKSYREALGLVTASLRESRGKTSSY